MTTEEKEICLALSNITASSQEHIESIILNNKIISLLMRAYTVFGASVKYEILYLFYNAFYIGNNYIRSELIRLNIQMLFINMLKYLMSDFKDKLSSSARKIIKLILEGFVLFLDYGQKITPKMNHIKSEMELEDVPEILSKLQFETLPEIYDTAHTILCNYWNEEENYYQDPNDLMNLR